MKKMISLIACLFLWANTILVFAQDSAQKYFANDKTKYNNGDYKSAIEDFNKAIETDPDYTPHIRYLSNKPVVL
jgi:tetratricopeptide (TPR) repeat protein